MSPLLALLLAAQDPALRELAETAARGDYERTEALGAAYVERHPQSAHGWFYLGHARAARGRWAEAVDPLQNSVRLGLKDPKARFQLGVAAHRAGRHELAVETLSEVLPALPEPDEARYCLGVSQFELRRDAEAEATLGPLAAGAGPWKALALYHRGLARRRQGREAEAVEDLRAAGEQTEAPELRARAQELIEAPARVSFLALLKAGYDSNVLLLPDTSVARGSAEGAAFFMSFASGEASLTEDLRLRAGALDLRYDGVPGADLNALLGELEGSTEWEGVGVARLALHGDLFHLDHEPFFRRTGLQAAIQRATLPGLTLEAGALWMAKDFRPDEFQPMDAVETGARLEARWAALPERLDLRLAYRFLRENADADDLDARTNRGDLGVTWHPAADLEARLDGWLSKAGYDGGRRDRRRGLRAATAWAPRAGLQLFVEFEADVVDSTADLFDYRRRVGAVGASLSF